jgi:quercetin dioxygenase-like cupin family protein
VRRFLTGVDAAGRSCVIEDADPPMEGSPAGILSAAIYSTESAPPPPRPDGQGRFSDLGVAPGLINWRIVDFEPNVTRSMHHTDTLDFDMVLEGSIELGLEDGQHLLEPGDCVVVAGVDHSWTAGPSGCRMSVTLIGTPSPG